MSKLDSGSGADVAVGARTHGAYVDIELYGVCGISITYDTMEGPPAIASQTRSHRVDVLTKFLEQIGYVRQCGLI